MHSVQPLHPLACAADAPPPIEPVDERSARNPVLTVPVGGVPHGGNTDELRVRLNEQHEQWLREQYMRDLADVDPNGCFFCEMGRLHAARGGHGA